MLRLDHAAVLQPRHAVLDDVLRVAGGEIGAGLEQVIEPCRDAGLEVGRRRRPPQRVGHDRRGQHLVELAGRFAEQVGEIEDVLPRLRVAAGDRDGLAEDGERARSVAHRQGDHLGQFVRERALPPLHAAQAREHPVLEQQVV